MATASRSLALEAVMVVLQAATLRKATILHSLVILPNRWDVEVVVWEVVVWL